jgi:hypothetical protein
MKFSLLSLLIPASIALFPVSVAAAPKTREIVPTIVRVPTPLNKVLDVDLYPGVGTTLNFGNVGEKVESIVLNNKSFVGLTTNTCMGQDKCEASPTIINIALIDKLDIDGVRNVNRKAKQAVLTVSTNDSKGKTKIYIFNLRLAKKNAPAIALIDFVPAPVSPQTNYLTTLKQVADRRQERVELIANLVAGLKLGNEKNIFKDYPKGQFEAVKNAILAVNNGQELSVAAASYGADMSLISKLILLAKQQLPTANIPKNPAW